MKYTSKTVKLFLILLGIMASIAITLILLTDNDIIEFSVLMGFFAYALMTMMICDKAIEKEKHLELDDQ